MRGRGVFIVNLYISASGSESGIDNFFKKSVYCLSGLWIVRKNRHLPKYFNSKEVFILS